MIVHFFCLVWKFLESTFLKFRRPRRSLNQASIPKHVFKKGGGEMFFFLEGYSDLAQKLLVFTCHTRIVSNAKIPPFSCRCSNSLKISTVWLKIMGNVFTTFSDFYEFFGIQKYFLNSTTSKILKIEYCESGSDRKIQKKIYLDSRQNRVRTNNFLDFYKPYLFFPMTFMKNMEIPWNSLIFVILEILGKSQVSVVRC